MKAIAVKLTGAERLMTSSGEVPAMPAIRMTPAASGEETRPNVADKQVKTRKRRKEVGKIRIDWDDVIFEIDLLKSQEINLDYILELIFENNKKKMDKSSLIEEIRRVIRSSVGNRAKESLIVDFINDANLDVISDRTEIIKAFFEYAQTKQKKEASDLIESENLNEREAKHYIEVSLRREYASENGTDFNNILPKMSPLKDRKSVV